MSEWEKSLEAQVTKLSNQLAAVTRDLATAVEALEWIERDGLEAEATIARNALAAIRGTREGGGRE